MKIVAILTLVIGSNYSVAQELTETKKKARYYVLFGMARSTFEVHGVPGSPNYPTLELRAGIGIAKSLGNSFQLKSGVNFGLKFKRDSYFYGPTKQFTNEPYVTPGLDETASNRDHFVTDIPVMLQFIPPNSNLSVRTGLNARLWGANNKNIDDLSSRRELGILAGISYVLTTRINLGIDVYYGLTNIYFRGIVNSTPNPTYLKVTNQYAQITVEYSLRKITTMKGETAK